MKRTCRNCKALSDGPKGLYCSLGYRTEGKFYKGIEIGLIPLEECPKPSVYSEFLRLLKERKERKWKKSLKN